MAAKKKLIPKVTSLYDLRVKALADERYARLAIVAAENLGGGSDLTLQRAMDWLRVNANETIESGVVKEVNFVRDLI